MVRILYVLRETAVSVRRSLGLAVAGLITVAVSLSLVGASLLLRQAVENATQQFRAGVEFIVYMQPTATPEQIESVRRDLTESPQVERVTYFTQEDAYAEFQELFRNSPQMVAGVTPADMPSSFRVVPVEKDTEVIRALGEQFSAKPGVEEVVFAADAIESLLNLTRVAGNGTLLAAVVLLVAAVVLILNTIRLSVSARRREIEVMRLVGASSWFIRIPFTLEGFIEGLAGGLAAWVSVFLFSDFLQDSLRNSQGLALLQQFSVTPSEVFGTGVLLAVIGAVVGAVGSALAVTFYVDA